MKINENQLKIIENHWKSIKKQKYLLFLLIFYYYSGWKLIFSMNYLKFQKFKSFKSFIGGGGDGGCSRCWRPIQNDSLCGRSDLKFQIHRATFETLMHIWNFKYFFEKFKILFYESLIHIWNFKYSLEKINIFAYENQ